MKLRNLEKLVAIVFFVGNCKTEQPVRHHNIFHNDAKHNDKLHKDIQYKETRYINTTHNDAQ